MRAYPGATRFCRPDKPSGLGARFRPVRGLIWELVWRNRILLTVQVMLYCWGAVLSLALERFGATG